MNKKQSSNENKKLVEECNNLIKLYEKCVRDRSSTLSENEDHHSCNNAIGYIYCIIVEKTLKKRGLMNVIYKSTRY